MVRTLRRLIVGIVLAGFFSPLYAVPMSLAAGGTHSLVLASDGRVYQWGEGAGVTPASVFGLDNVIAIAAGERHALALKSDGTVWAWGDNHFGQLGDGSVIPHDHPKQIAGLSGITAIACGPLHCYALRQDGTISAWGSNQNGQLGDGTHTDRRSPVTVENFSGIQAIAAGSSHLLALRKDGTVCSWGLEESDPFYQSSLKRSSGKPVPLCISEFSGVKAIAAGGNSSYALREDGTVWVWGTSPCGKGGSFSTLLTRQPILDRVEKLSASATYTLLVRDDDTVWSCGTPFRELRITDDFNTSSPQEVRELTQITDVAAGVQHALARSRSGVLWSWGKNNYGQLGTGDRNDREAPGYVWDGTGELTRP